ncbi:MAG: hypothetical protein RI964_1871 [Pseudomonadota bacterium]|jgi:nitrogen fixation protein FixH
MENQSLLITLTVGVLASFTLFFIFHKLLHWSSKLAALVTILITQIVYIPLSIKYWAGLDVFAIHFAFFTMTAAGLGIVTGTRATDKNTDAAPKSRFHWAPGIIIGFFITLAIIDSFIITLANNGASADFVHKYLPAPNNKKVGTEVTSAFSGTVAHDFQKDFNHYNQYVDQMRQQKTLGWRLMDGWIDIPQEGKPAMFRLRVIDDEGMAIANAQVSVKFLFTADKSKDTEVTLPEIEPGAYGQPIALPQSGKWMLLIKVAQGNNAFEVKGETVVAPNATH